MAERNQEEKGLFQKIKDYFTKKTSYNDPEAFAERVKRLWPLLLLLRLLLSRVSLVPRGAVATAATAAAGAVAAAEGADAVAAPAATAAGIVPGTAVVAAILWAAVPDQMTGRTKVSFKW